jgi:hypothetical protein
MSMWQSSSRRLTLDVGEDRIVLDSPGQIGQQAYKLDVFIPYSVDQDKCSATFNTDTKVNDFIELFLIKISS